MTKTFVQFGAGNIGRSFLGQLFGRSGYEIVFVDVDKDLIANLNAQGAYRVVIKHPDGRDEMLRVENVRAVDGRDLDAVEELVAECDLAATAVGARALGAVAPALARGLNRRKQMRGGALDIILAENLQGAADFLEAALLKNLPEDFDLKQRAGLVETSIGKMVPNMRQEDLLVDPLWVFAEPYNTLIVDAKGFLNPIPQVDGLAPVENIQAYVDRKLFVHNLGHSATAYLGFQENPEWEYIYEALEDHQVAAAVRRAMEQSCAALQKEYPETFTAQDLKEHVDDLLSRFSNRALGDTIHRVGRDLTRKLDKQDRLVGALLLALKHGLEADAIAQAIRAGVKFRKGNENGKLFPADAEFARKEAPQVLEHVLRSVSHLERSDPLENRAINSILKTHGGEVTL